MITKFLNRFRKEPQDCYLVFYEQSGELFMVYEKALTRTFCERFIEDEFKADPFGRYALIYSVTTE